MVWLPLYLAAGADKVNKEKTTQLISKKVRKAACKVSGDWVTGDKAGGNRVASDSTVT